MAALMYKSSPLLGFRAAKNHLSIFPFSSEAVDAVRDQLRAFHLSKGTVRFTTETPLPEQAVHEMLRHRVAEIDERGIAPKRRP